MSEPIDLSTEQCKDIAKLLGRLMDLATASAPDRPELEIALSVSRGWSLEATHSQTLDDDSVSMKTTPGTMPAVLRGKGGHSNPTESAALAGIVTCRRCHKDVNIGNKGSAVCRCGATVYALRDGQDQTHRVLVAHLGEFEQAAKTLITDILSTQPVRGSAKLRAARDPKNDTNEKECTSDKCHRPQKDAKSRHCKACAEYLDDHPHIRVVPKEIIASREAMAELRERNRIRVSGPHADAIPC